MLGQISRGNINLDPIFQRRSAWNTTRQSLFIESLVLGLPIPQLILAEDRRKKGSYIVIDGKQRLLAIRAFSARTDGDDFTPLRLRGLKEMNQINGKRYQDLLKDDAFSDELAAFENSSIRTVIIRNWSNEAYLYEVFLRINTGSVQLSPQELRQALHPGQFSKFVDKRSADSLQLQKALSLTGPDFRMRDAELLLRYLAYANFAELNQGNLKRFLDETTRKLNESWDKDQRSIEEQCNQLENAISFTKSIFGNSNYFRKWNGTDFERRTNRAVMDIMLYYFSNPKRRELLNGKNEQIVNAFKSLCETDREFLTSFETTTKSLAANAARFNRWAEELSIIVGEKIRSPYEDI